MTSDIMSDHGFAAIFSQGWGHAVSLDLTMISTDRVMFTHAKNKSNGHDSLNTSR